MIEDVFVTDGTTSVRIPKELHIKIKETCEVKKPTAICLEIRKETELALFVTDGVIESTWIPKSQIIMNEDGGPGDFVEIQVPEWLAIKKGLI